MSTKIYDAYKYEGNLSSLLNSLKEIRHLYQEDKIELLSSLDNLEIEVEKDKKIKLINLHEEILGEIYLSRFLEKRISIGYNEPTNIQASAVIYPHNNDIYVKFFGIKNKFIDDIKEFKDFHYQNQVDMSNYDWDKEDWDKMTKERQDELEEDWDNRCRIWEEILGDDTFGEAGFTFDFHPSGYNLTLFCINVFEKMKRKHVKV
jgi:hypothetical protein